MAENGKAKYYALMEEMKTDILSGKIRPGEKLPSENQLSVRYGAGIRCERLWGSWQEMDT